MHYTITDGTEAGALSVPRRSAKSALMAAHEFIRQGHTVAIRDPDGTDLTLPELASRAEEDY